MLSLPISSPSVVTLSGRMQGGRLSTVQHMIDLGLSRTQPNTPHSGSLADRRPCGPSLTEIVFEIGLVLVLHLAVAVAVLLLLDALVKR